MLEIALCLSLSLSNESISRRNSNLGQSKSNSEPKLRLLDTSACYLSLIVSIPTKEASKSTSKVSFVSMNFQSIHSLLLGELCKNHKKKWHFTLRILIATQSVLKPHKSWFDGPIFLSTLRA